MAATARRTVPIADRLELEVTDCGTGEPVVVIQTALTGDELLPLTELLAQGTGLRATHLGRRGYGTSSPGRAGTTVDDMAADCRDAIRALGIVPAHVVGASFSCVVALSLVTLAPSHVHSRQAAGGTVSVAAVRAPGGGRVRRREHEDSGRVPVLTSGP